MIENIEKSLTPLQQARLRLLQHFLSIAVLNAVVGAATFFASNNRLDVNRALWFLFAQVLLALVDTTVSYFQAQGDTAAASAVQRIGSQVATRIEAQHGLPTDPVGGVHPDAPGPSFSTQDITDIVSAVMREVAYPSRLDTAKIPAVQLPPEAEAPLPGGQVH